MRPRWAELFASEIDGRAVDTLSYVGAALFIAGVWIAAPTAWVAVGWLAGAIVFGMAARRFDSVHLVWQSHVLAACAALRILAVNQLALSQPPKTMDLLPVIGVVAGLYTASMWTPRSLEWFKTSRRAHAWVAGLIAALTMWYVLQPVTVALAWGLLGIVLLELGAVRSRSDLRLQGHAALVAAFMRTLVVNLNAGAIDTVVSPRLYTMLPLALTFFYAYARLAPRDEGVEHRWRLRNLHAWLGIATVVALIRFEAPPELVIVFWAVYVFVLAFAASVTAQRIFLHGALVLSALVIFRASLYNFYLSDFFPLQSGTRGHLRSALRRRCYSRRCHSRSGCGDRSPEVLVVLPRFWLRCMHGRNSHSSSGRLCS